MSELQTKINTAIERLKAFEPADEPYYLCFSGGKDSDCIRILADLAGVKHDIVHNLTTVDAPETVRYIKSIPNVQIKMPKYSMWQLIEKKKIPPTRLVRYCCSELKEKGGKGRVKVTGVRWAESASRKQNGGIVKIIGKPKSTIALAEELQAEYEQAPKGGIILNTDNDESRRKADFIRYPKYRDNYLRAFRRMLKAREAAGLDNSVGWNTPEAVMMWWVGDNPLQMSFETPEYLK